MDGSERLQPRPNGPFPEFELYVSEIDGLNPERQGGVNMGSSREAIPVKGLTTNFSSMPLTMPPSSLLTLVGYSLCSSIPVISLWT